VYSLLLVTATASGRVQECTITTVCDSGLGATRCFAQIFACLPTRCRPLVSTHSAVQLTVSHLGCWPAAHLHNNCSDLWRSFPSYVLTSLALRRLLAFS
jgi:hypothetical protein